MWRKHRGCRVVWRLQLNNSANDRFGSTAERLTASISRPQHPDDQTKYCDAGFFSALGQLRSLRSQALSHLITTQH
jgi:hypothetical protein